MNEDQKKWLLYLQEKGIKFEYYNLRSSTWNSKPESGDKIRFNSFEQFRIPDQTIPDIPDWRELCKDMQSKGVKFERDSTTINGWISGTHAFCLLSELYRIPQQPIPEWREEMTEETKPDPREEIPHRELQIQWHEDMLHHLRTGEPMREWEWKKKSDGTWSQTIEPGWDAKTEYRRKPRTVTYWHCLVRYVTGAIEFEVLSDLERKYLVKKIEEMSQYAKKCNRPIKFSPIIETTVEVED